MKFFILACFLATAAALDDTEDVKMAKAMFYKAFDAAEKGELAMLQAPQIPNAYLADDAAVAAAKPYLADDAAVAAAKPYVADSADVMAAKAEFKKYFDAREMGIPATPGALEPVQYAAPVAHYAPVAYSNPIYHNYGYAAAPYAYNYAGYNALPYAYNNWAHSGLSPYYYAPNTYANILPYAAWPTVAAAPEEQEE